MPRLLRLFRCHIYGSLAKGCGGILYPILHRSPVGGSTLITSAPKSDKITAAPGPAMKLARSTTFNPEKILSVAISASLSYRQISALPYVTRCAHTSPPLELWRSLFKEGRRAFLLVFCS